MIVSSIVRNQQQTFLRLWRGLEPHLHSDRGLPSRIQQALHDRSFGALDRRLYRELMYTTVRYFPWFQALARRSESAACRAMAWLAASTPATQRFRAALLADWPAPPPAIADRAAFLDVTASLLPEWFQSHCPDAFLSPNLEVLHTRPPLWIRMQTAEPKRVLAELEEHGWLAHQSEDWSEAWQILDEADLPSLAAFREGRFEVQDLGSQLVLASVDLPAGGRWLDACAGAGGKTLQLARMLGTQGRVEAYDVRIRALEELRQRTRRAGLKNIQLLSRPPAVQPSYDGVLIDAPCSGSGTWRRAPHLKWSTHPETIADASARQLELLKKFGRLVRPGGRLIYATCSLSRHENEEVIAAWVGGGAGFAVEPPARAFGGAVAAEGLTLLPALHDTDGYFVASLRRVA